MSDDEQPVERSSGWFYAGRHYSGQGDLYRCASDVCGATVHGVERLEAHDREFHLITLGPNTGMNGGAYDLRLDGHQIGTVAKYEKRYNLVRLVVDRGWKTQGGISLLHGKTFEDSDRTLGPILDRLVVEHPLAKAWGRGKRPAMSAWKRPVLR